MFSCQAPAKINLFLEVVARRADGYHDLQSVFQEIDLADHLTANLADEIRLTCDAAEIPTDERNLVVKALRRLQELAGVRDGLSVHLEKRIPAGGGMGGGSSDAAAAIRLACKAWNLSLRNEDLLQVALAIGSDVPFFLYGGACLCEGRGEIITPLSSAPALSICLILPPWGVATKNAYGALAGEVLGTRKIDAFLRAFQGGDLTALAEESYNRFESVVFQLEPRQRELQRRLTDCGPLVVRMSGSGSSVWCLLKHGQGIHALQSVVGQFPGCRLLSACSSRMESV